MRPYIKEDDYFWSAECSHSFNQARKAHKDPATASVL